MPIYLSGKDISRLYPVGRVSRLSSFLFLQDGAGTVTVPFDGTSLIYRPTSSAEFAAMGWPTPSLRFQLQEAAGSIVDDVHGYTLAPAASPQYLQTGSDPSGFASVGVGTLDGIAAQGFSGSVGTTWDPTFQSLAVYQEFEVRSVPPSGTRAMVAFTGAASAYVAMVNVTAHARLSLRGPSTANGTVNYDDGRRHPLLVEWMPGAVAGGQIINHTTSRYRISTDKEQFSAVWAGVADSTKGLGCGGSVSLFAGNNVFFDMVAFAGSSAELIGDTLTPKVFLQRRGWVVTGY